MSALLYGLWQWIWGLPQNLVGAAFRLWYRAKGCPGFSYQGASVTIWTNPTGSMSMGRFLFLHPDWTPEDQALLAHEYGHTIQSLLLGPLYLPAVGLPSVIWAGLPALQRLRRRRHISYYAVYPENWATRLGERFAQKPAALPRPEAQSPAP